MILLVLILVIGQGMLYAWLLLYQKAYLEKTTRAEVAATASHIAELASKDISDKTLDQFIDSILKGGLVMSVKITGPDGKTKIKNASSGPGGSGERGFSPFFIFYIDPVNSVTAPLDQGALGAGKVELTYSGEHVNEIMGRFLFLPPVMQATILILMVFAITWSFRKKISKPVDQINGAIEKIVSGDLTVEVPEGGDDEIGSIAGGFRFLIERFSTSIARLNSLSVNVATAMGQLMETFNSISDAARTQAKSINKVVSAVKAAHESQLKTTDNTDKLSRASSENVSSLLEMKAAADEISASMERLFRSTADSYAMVAEMTQTAKAIAGNASEVSVVVEYTTTAVEQINASLNTVQENTKTSSELTALVRRLLTERGTLAVADAIAAMEKIVEEVGHSADVINRLDERSKDIEKVLSVIKEVTEKTNLLSLNAAILASQAGEYGKGFSVVADEIRSLSDKTSSSAKDIADIVQVIQSEIHGVADAVHGAVKRVEEGKALILESGDAIRETLEVAQKSAQTAKIVEDAAEEQAGGLSQIRLSMENISLMIEQVVKATEEAKRGSSQMLDSISDVKEVAEFVKKGTDEHALGTNVISNNLELTMEMVSGIDAAAQSQMKGNEKIMDAVKHMEGAGESVLKDIEDITLSFNTLKDEIEMLKEEMGAFKTKNSERSAGVS